MTRTLFRAGSRAGSRAVVLAVAALLVPATGTAPAAAATTYSVTHANDPATGQRVVVRWAPCVTTSTGTRTHVITYRVNGAGHPTRVRLVKRALARLTTASGLRFRYLGRTSYIPHNAVLHYPTGDRYIFDAAQERARTGAELVVAWASMRASNLLTPSEAGVGTVSWSGNYRSQLRIVQAAVVMKRGVRLAPGFSAGATGG
jgi:hypothetical protein